jgi:single-strand DNA-binding protein|tara:strand:- start:1 stop:405 length:405 start_codon:yes stop_codon:yes gene_type:complete
MNKVMLIGNLGKDAEIRTFQNNTDKVCNFSIATTEKWKDKNTGSKQEKTQWHSIAVFNQSMMGMCEAYLKKGKQVLVEGQLETRKWQDQSGNDRYKTEVVVRNYSGGITLLGGQSDTSQPNLPTGNDIDDEIPF